MSSHTLRSGFMVRGILLVVAVSMFGLACQQPHYGRPEERIRFSIEPSRSNVLVGETVTILTESRNLIGREAQIEWSASGGELFTEDNRRIARVRFDQPGNYIVEARLFMDDRIVRSDSTTIRVRPVP